MDNQGSILLSNTTKQHTRSKHIDIRYHFIGEKIFNKELKLIYMPSEQNVADIFTKATPKERFKKLVSCLNLFEVSRQEEVLNLDDSSPQYMRNCTETIKDLRMNLKKIF